MGAITHQITDSFKYKDDQWEFFDIEIEGDELYIPPDFGIAPLFRSTQCEKGFSMFWEIKNRQLILNAILINTDGIPPPINEIEPTPGPRSILMFDYIYKDLNIKEKFSGKLLLNNLKESSFKAKVMEFTIQNGDIISEEYVPLTKDDYYKRQQKGFKKKMDLDSKAGTVYLY